MAITINQKVAFLVTAKGLWIEIQRHLNAYSREYTKGEKVLNALKATGLVAALFTAIVAIIKPQFPDIVFEKYIIIGAILTAIITTVEKVYLPSVKAKDFWEAKSDCESLQRELIILALSIYSADETNLDVDLFRSINDRLRDATRKNPFTPQSEDQKIAETKYSETSICSYLRFLEGHEVVETSVIVATAVDTPGLIPVIRR